MAITIDEIKRSLDPLFRTPQELEAAFQDQTLIDEVNRAIQYVDDGNSIDSDFFNRVLTASYLGPVERNVFDRYFPRGINSAEKLQEGIESFIRDALLHFGSFHQAFLRIKADPDVIPHHTRTFGNEDRAPFRLSREIPVDKLAYLGYVSGELPARMDKAHRQLLNVIRGTEGAAPAREPLTVERLRARAAELGIRLEAAIEEINEGLKARAAGEQLTIESFQHRRDEIEATIKSMLDEVREYRGFGLKNLEQYINICADIDVYVATSMRDDRDYREMKAFIDQVFGVDERAGRRDIARLKLRYFDPTQAYCANKYDKGLIECLMIRCAKVTIYCAQRQDTMGKDSELAITLGQGKPVIVYVPEGEPGAEREAYDKRARVFSEVHPLSLQVDQKTGVTNGIILVRTATQCADVLYALAKNQLRTKVERIRATDPLSGQDYVCWVLRETMTGNNSVIRMATGWKHLRTAFWAAYRPDVGIT